MLVNKDMTGYEVVKYLGDKYDDIFAKGYARGKVAGYVGTDAKLYAREYAKGYAIGRAEGRAEGRTKEKIETAKRMKDLGLDTTTISLSTGLSEQEIMEI